MVVNLSKLIDFGGGAVGVSVLSDKQLSHFEYLGELTDTLEDPILNHRIRTDKDSRSNTARQVASSASIN